MGIGGLLKISDLNRLLSGFQKFSNDKSISGDIFYSTHGVRLCILISFNLIISFSLATRGFYSKVFASFLIQLNSFEEEKVKFYLN